ncbi:hypothetical protein [Schaalia radingae]|uniref:Uncharacterized protein n=1 Tax=Schaalia radingae TaxID=131110 RepID=A0ABY0V4Z3_9ACTO|nr:hypothetical protein [Schaalia radingae]SDT85836.1 hypothetical protein SAMN04489714_0172 [Schaalia radingae]
MSIRLSKVPAKRTRTGLFDQIISEEELQQIMSAAPKTFEVISDSGAPWTKADVSAVTRAANVRGFRVSSRRLNVDNDNANRMWIYYAPASQSATRRSAK